MTLALLSTEALHEEAMRASGFSDFGDAGYLVPLRILIGAVSERSEHGAGEEPAVATMIKRVLVSRLYSEAGWHTSNNCLNNDIKGPVVITGLPRSGTTALHRIMALDPQFQCLEHWLTATPMVRPPRNTWTSRPEFVESAAAREKALLLTPGAKAVRFVPAEGVEECVQLLAQSFVSLLFSSTFDVPDYGRWLYDQDETASYRRYADNLRLIGAAEPQQTWLLKNPGHLFASQSLLAAFPDANVVQLYRTPLEAIPSLCSLVRSARRRFGQEASPAAIGHNQLELWSVAARRSIETRKGTPGRFFDVDFEQLVADPIGVVRDIYRHFELTMDVATEHAMVEWVDDNPRGLHGEHRYSASEFGLTNAQIHSAFEDYIERYRSSPISKWGSHNAS